MRRVLAGPHAVSQALADNPSALSVVYVADKPSRSRDALAEEARRLGVPVERRSAEDLATLAKGTRHQGVVAIASAFRYHDLDAILDQAPDPSLLLALDQITDPHNFGAILRTAVAFGVDGVITTKDRACPVTSVVARASAGATEQARIARVTNLARTLRDLSSRGHQIVGLAADGQLAVDQLGPISPGRVLVVGSEGHGLRRMVRKGCDVVVRIHMPGPTESLNASVAAGIAIREAAMARAAPDAST